MSSPPPTLTSPQPPSHWCYRCNRFVAVSTTLDCPDCNSGFVELIPNPTPSLPSPSPAHNPPRIRRTRRAAADRSPFNPVIVLRSPLEEAETGTGYGSSYDLYYDDGGGLGLRPLPSSVSDFLLGSGFDRLLDQLSQIEINGVGVGLGVPRSDHLPASKAAIESLQSVKIGETEVELELHCAVCKDAFELGGEVKEMPCKHLYHQDCILPWLGLRNSCPVCRFELETEGAVGDGDGVGVGEGEDETVGLTIWRLPGGGFAVGRFAGGRRGGGGGGGGGERELPVVYTEMDGGFNQGGGGGGVARRISWGSRGGRDRESGVGGVRRLFRNLFTCFRGGVDSNESTSSSSESRGDGGSSNRSGGFSVFGSNLRRNRGFDLGGRVRRW